VSPLLPPRFLATPTPPRRPLGLFFASLAALLAALAAPSPALANGRYPAAGQIVVAPNDPDHLIVRATYGVLSSRDAGQSWAWICEAAIGYGGIEDPMMGVTADGTYLAGIFNGLSVSRDSGCGWELAGGDLTKRFVTDLSVERADPSRAVLIVSNGLGPSEFLTQLWETSDNGLTWTQAGVDVPSSFLGLTVDVAPSDPQRVYVSGRYGPADQYLGAIQRSTNRGASWESVPVPGSNDTHLPYLSAVDPNNPDILYVRLDGDPVDVLLVSKNGGDTWQSAFESTGNLFGFALSPDGSTVYVGGSKDGLWRAPTASLAFEKVSSVSVRCLTATDSLLYACGDEFTDGFTIGVSTTQGSTWTPLMHLASPCGPLQCGDQTAVHMQCEKAWGETKLVLGAEACEGDAGPMPAPTPPAPEGCGCRAAPTAGTGAALGAAAGVILASRRRRRRRLNTNAKNIG
jgi:MYXO-CTERM domain-containing protein